MQRAVKWTVAITCLASCTVRADTRTPYPAGEAITVVTASGSITGKLQDSATADWVYLVESKSGDEIRIPLSAIQVLRRVAPRLEGARAAAHPAAEGVSSSRKYVVYVHGICQHGKGYSESWWSSMKRFVDVPEANQVEILWSDIVNEESAAQDAQSLASQQETSRRIKETLRDRANRQAVQAFGNESLDRAAQEGVLDNIPLLNCVDDFTRYMLNDDTRNRILARFDEKVKPLLHREGTVIEVISHSWGTVVAYEALRRMDLDAEVKGSVHNLFSVGSALSIGEVRANLLPANRNCKRPRFVNRWTNINARFDIVGGHIPGAIDEENLDLRPVGCSLFPNPVCSHSSYFHADNLAVNRDIFGRAIISN
jgi:hypothetical protein